MAKFTIRHGHAAKDHKPETREYAAWNAMKRRCLNPNCECFSQYGGRGIKIAEKWMKFEGFLADMGHKPSPKHSLDRIDNYGNYEASNCRWATKNEQVRNRRITKRIEFRGAVRTVSELAEIFSISRRTLQHRLDIGWSPERAVTAPLRRELRR